MGLYKANHMTLNIQSEYISYIYLMYGNHSKFKAAPGCAY